MARPATRREGDKVQAYGCMGEIGATRRQGTGRASKAIALTRRHRIESRIDLRPSFDFNHRHDVALEGQDIDLGLGGSDAKTQDAISLENQPEGAKQLAETPVAPRF